MVNLEKLAANILSEHSGHGETTIQAVAQADGYQFVVRFTALDGTRREATVLCDSNGTQLSRTERP